ncbi:hypothetical protein [Paenibacillus luteus]|uniref:hypothetical protein n=1 Tax=Paenibacillus luteus TaxID=2545753 RepID=UPI001142B5F5|nr:hypothetical protein [Paenibacillus luteus]
MKQVGSLISILILLFCFPFTVFSEGDGNIDNGGGGMGSGTSQNKWRPGEEGVRVTVVRASDEIAVSQSLDYTNKTMPSNMFHFGKVSKIHYRNGSPLTPHNNSYTFKNPSMALPKIISSGSENINIEVIKQYFCSEGALKMIADDLGVSYETLTSGDYRLLLEPITYITFQGNYMAMTAHEAALYDQILSGELRTKMVSLTHQNLPLSMFLEKSDLSFPAWAGTTNGRVSNSEIISSLGLGVVRFTELPPPMESTAAYEYRTDTEVITSVFLSTGREITPKAPASVTFSLLGSSYTVTNIVIPEGDSQIVWFKWRTPSKPQTVTIQVSASEGVLSQQRITAKLVDLNQNVPPNPTAKDRNDSFSIPSLPKNKEKTNDSWGVWSASWHSNWVWIPNWQWYGTGNGGGYWVDNGHWEDQGWWDYQFSRYQASLSAAHSIQPDRKVPTAIGQEMKSGYGIQMKVNTNLTTNAPSSHFKGAQHAVAYFPEFQYKTYWRLYDRLQSVNQATFELKPNPYSTYNQRVHFTPIWYPDGSYIPHTTIIDAWTPNGMLQLNVSDRVQIKGNLFSDWHISPKK